MDSFRKGKVASMKHLPSLNALRAFDAVARLLSVSAAAAELAVTPSAISRQISNLEDDIGVALLTRNGRGLRLTADGERLERGLDDAFDQIAVAVDRLRKPARGNRVRILIPPIFASAWLIPRLDRFNARHPETDVILISKDEHFREPADADTLIGWGCFEDSATMVAEKLTGPEEVFPVCRPRLCEGGVLNGALLIDREDGGRGWTWPDWQAFLKAVGLEDRSAETALRLNPSLMLDAVREGQGVILANTTVAHDDLAAGRLVRPVAESLAIDECYWLLTSRPERNRAEVKAFRNWLFEEIGACFGRSR